VSPVATVAFVPTRRAAGRGLHTHVQVLLWTARGLRGGWGGQHRGETWTAGCSLSGCRSIILAALGARD